MLGERALKFNQKGCNCAQCILMACQEEYNIKISDDCLNACEGFYNGLGVGGYCGVLLASIMAIVMLCDDVAYYRLEMVERFNNEFNTLNCYNLKKENSCKKIIEISCNILADIIDKGRKKL